MGTTVSSLQILGAEEDAVRAALRMQPTREEGTAATNRYLKIGRFKNAQ